MILQLTNMKSKRLGWASSWFARAWGMMVLSKWNSY